METFLASAGSYPRIGAEPKHQRLRKAYGCWERGEITKEGFEKIQQSMVKAAIHEQDKAGLDLLTDGQIRWHDPVSHLAGKLEGVKIDGLLRFFDTNFYFRQPVITARLQWKGPLVQDEFTFAKKITKKPVKAILTGPYTLAKLSIIQTDAYPHLQDLVLDFAELMSREIEGLARAGATMIQIDEPAIIRHPNDFAILRQAVTVLARKKGNSRLALYTYFGDAAPIYDQLQSLPVEILGLDFTYSPQLADRVERDGSDKQLGLGLIDGRNTRLETKEEIFKLLNKILPRLKGDICYINPSCGLEYLPRDKAYRKLANMVKLKKMFQERGVRP
ncbi:MAG TPA: methylcobamide--CoM methyltransferase [Nitrospiria bacterium]|jgi:5-methyltetrahydropteroyltriglutamate--homocysteine methyltransferase|nr:methylcobamide--CoM methyltransferase [Nitrospiria bacterium]